MAFLAADWVDQPYAICPRTLASDPVAEKTIATQSESCARVRIPDPRHAARSARREWDFAMRKLDDVEKRLAMDLAYRRGWYDRAVFFYSADHRKRNVFTNNASRSRWNSACATKRATQASIPRGPTRSSAPKARG